MLENERKGLYGILYGIGSIICILIIVFSLLVINPAEIDIWEKLGAILAVSLTFGALAVLGTIAGIFYSIISLVDEPSKYGFISLGLNLGLVVFFLVILGISFA